MQLSNKELVQDALTAFQPTPIARSIFKKRMNVRPEEYPELAVWKDAIRQSYWVHTEFNFTSDIQDFKINISEKEREIISRCMLAISQIEVQVKRSWADLYYAFPKPEIDDIGTTFAESEVRHKDAYAELLNKLGLSERFEKILEVEPLVKRIKYMEEFNFHKRSGNPRQYILFLVLFSIFIEHISLFSQFLIMMSFNKYQNQFKGLSNAIQATSKEEEIHGQFGLELYNIIRNENPELFDESFYEDLKTLSDNAIMAEIDIIDWIFEFGELDFLPKKYVKNYIFSRYARSLEALSIEHDIIVHEDWLKETEWFDIGLLVVTETDFFNKRSTDYSKKTRQFTIESVFGDE